MMSRNDADDRLMNPELVAMLKAMFDRRSDIGAGVWELLALLGGGPQVAIDNLATKLDRNRRTAVRNLRKLEQAGIVQRRSIPGRANSYAVRLNEGDR